MNLGQRLRWAVLRRAYDGSTAARRLGVSVGDGCRILSLEVASEPWLLAIGDRVTVSSSVLFVTHDGSGCLAEDEEGRRFRYGRINIGDDVFIGARAIILPGIDVGSNVIIGAGSLVTRSVPDGVVVAGNPARVIGSFDRARSKMLKDWKRLLAVDDYVKRTKLMADDKQREPLEWPGRGAGQ